MLLLTQNCSDEVAAKMNSLLLCCFFGGRGFFACFLASAFFACFMSAGFFAAGKVRFFLSINTVLMLLTPSHSLRTTTLANVRKVVPQSIPMWLSDLFPAPHCTRSMVVRLSSQQQNSLPITKKRPWRWIYRLETLA